MIQIVIDIPEKLYKALKDYNEGDAWDAVEAIINGTPLPKGHGRLIDANALAKRMTEYGWHHSDSTVHEFVDDLPTIIEADKEGVEE